jgi:hypothetical protein
MIARDRSRCAQGDLFKKGGTMGQHWLWSLAALAVCLAGGARGLALGEAAGPVALTALEGHARVMENYAEHRCTLVVFLTSRCAASREAIGALNGIHAMDTDEKMLIVGISANPAETAAELKTYLQRSGVVFPVYRDAEGAAARQFGARVTPACFLLDREGKLLFHGDVAGAGAAVKAVLAGEKAPRSAEKLAGTPIGEAGTPAEIANPYPPVFFQSETIFEEIPGAPVHHCSTLAEAANGDLVCTWYGGSYESAEDQVLFSARQAKGARDWSAPEVLIRNPDSPPGNAITFRGPNDVLWIVWSRMEGSRPTRRGTGWGKCRLLQRTSTDHGHTWSEDTELPESLGWLPRNPPVWIDGALHLPLSAFRNGVDGGMLLRLGADGAGWTPLGMLPRGEQLSVAPRADGSLLGIARSMPFVLMSESQDKGATWGPAQPTPLKCPDSSNCLLRLASGRFILAHNDNDGWDRATLAIAQSEDEGRSWGKAARARARPRLRERRVFLSKPPAKQ